MTGLRRCGGSGGPANVCSDGALILVVGPSGAGKDSILRAGRVQLAHASNIRFAQRFITRPPSADEDNLSLSRRQYEAAKALGGFLLSWDAHGLNYGLPANIGIDLVCGTTVVANCSRGVVEAARGAWPRTLVVLITASSSVLRQRLLGRGRSEDVESRIARPAADLELLRPDLVIVNDHELDAAVDTFVTFVGRIANAATSAPLDAEKVEPAHNH